jgi:hypothetical protein
MLDITRITPSMLKKYEECPLSFFYNYVLGLRLDQQMMHLNFGTAIHLALDNIFEQCDDDVQWEHAEFSIVKKIFVSEFTEDKVTSEGFETEKDRLDKWQALLEDGIAMLEAFWKEKERLYINGVKPTEFEVMMKFEPFNPETKELLSVPLSLRIDGLNNDTLKIFEFKTSSAKYNVVDTRTLPQTLAYVWAMYCKTGKLYSVDYVVLIKNRKKDRIQHLHYDYDLADVLAFDGRVRNILTKIENREYNLNNTCKVGYCDCKKYKALLDVNGY